MSTPVPTAEPPDIGHHMPQHLWDLIDHPAAADATPDPALVDAHRAFVAEHLW